LLTGASCGASVTALAPSTVYELAKRDLAWQSIPKPAQLIAVSEQPQDGGAKRWLPQ